MTATQRQRAPNHTDDSGSAAMLSAAAASDSAPDALDIKKQTTDPALRQKILLLCALLVLLLLWSLGQDWTARPLILPGTRPRPPPLAVVPGAPVPGEHQISGAAIAGVPAMAGLSVLNLALPWKRTIEETPQQQQYAVLIPSSIRLDSGGSRNAAATRFPLLFVMHAATPEISCESWRALAELHRWIVVCPSMHDASIESLHAVLEQVMAPGSSAHGLGRIVDGSAVMMLSEGDAALPLWIQLMQALPNHWTAAGCLRCAEDGAGAAKLPTLDASTLDFRARYYSSRSVVLVGRSSALSASSSSQSISATATAPFSEWLRGQFGFDRVDALQSEHERQDREFLAAWWAKRL